MIVLQTGSDGSGGYNLQDIFFIPRPSKTTWSGTYNQPILTDEITGDNITINGFNYNYISNGDYVKLSFTPEKLIEGRTYSFVITEIDDLGEKRAIYKDKIFVTDQEINQVNEKSYNINKGTYVEKETSTNDYIVL